MLFGIVLRGLGGVKESFDDMYGVLRVQWIGID